MKFLLSKKGGVVLYGISSLYLLVEIFAEDLMIEVPLIFSWGYVGTALSLIVYREVTIKRNAK